MKYGNTKASVNGRVFDSYREAQRYIELSLLERAGQINGLECQKEYVLIPAQYAGKKCVERAVKYVADFVYTENGQTVVEDVKGFRTKEYIIKRKLMRYVHGIEIREV